jgi:membrane protein required for colicin V production
MVNSRRFWLLLAMNVYDWVILILVVAGALLGLRSGAVGTALTIAGVFVAMLLGAQFAGRIVPTFTDSITNEAVITALGYVIIFVAVFIAVSILSRVAKVAMTITFTGWIDKLAGIVVGLAVGVLISLALTMFLARLAYVFDTGDRGDQNKLNAMVEQHIESGVRDQIDRLLTGSALVPVLIDISKAVPADAFGLVPADFRTAFSVLESRTDNG